MSLTLEGAEQGTVFPMSRQALVAQNTSFCVHNVNVAKIESIASQTAAAELESTMCLGHSRHIVDGIDE